MRVSEWDALFVCCVGVRCDGVESRGLGKQCKRRNGGWEAPLSREELNALN